MSVYSLLAVNTSFLILELDLVNMPLLSADGSVRFCLQRAQKQSRYHCKVIAKDKAFFWVWCFNSIAINGI
jgi:hypothetical protein